MSAKPELSKAIIKFCAFSESAVWLSNACPSVCVKNTTPTIAAIPIIIFTKKK